MTKFAHHLIEARQGAPERLKCPDFDAWLFDLLLKALEPFQEDVLLWVVSAGREGIVTNDLCLAAHSTPQRAGSAISDLRKLGLVHSHTGDDPRYGKQARHFAAAWVSAAFNLSFQLQAEFPDAEQYAAEMREKFDTIARLVREK